MNVHTFFDPLQCMSHVQHLPSAGLHSAHLVLQQEHRSMVLTLFALIFSESV